jgi:hypothetical protein
MHAQAATELADPQLRRPCRKVLGSLQEHWPGLTRFVEDQRIPLDNNVAERHNRGPAVARKNYYGSGALWSGRLAAMLFTLFATVTLGRLNVRRWLERSAGSRSDSARQQHRLSQDYRYIIPQSALALTCRAVLTHLPLSKNK